MRKLIRFLALWGHPESWRRRYGAAAPMRDLVESVFNRHAMKQLIERQDLYREARAKQPLEEVTEQMRRSIAIELASAGAFRVRFTYPDAQKAQQVPGDLIDLLVTGNAKAHGPTLTVTTPPGVPATPTFPNPMHVAGAGAGGGILLGVGAMILNRRRRL